MTREVSSRSYFLPKRSFPGISTAPVLRDPDGTLMALPNNGRFLWMPENSRRMRIFRFEWGSVPLYKTQQSCALWASYCIASLPSSKTCSGSTDFRTQLRLSGPSTAQPNLLFLTHLPLPLYVPAFPWRWLRNLQWAPTPTTHVGVTEQAVPCTSAPLCLCCCSLKTDSSA